MELGQRIRQLRQERGLSQRELGRRAGLSHGAVSHLELGIRSPSAATVARIARALDVDSGELLSELLEDPAPAVPLAESPRLFPPESVGVTRGFDEAFEKLRLEADDLRKGWVLAARQLVAEVENAREAGATERLRRLLRDATSLAERASNDSVRLLDTILERLLPSASKLPEAASALRRHALASLATEIRNDAHALEHAANVAEVALDLPETERRKAAEATAEAQLNKVVSLAVARERRRGAELLPNEATGESQAG